MNELLLIVSIAGSRVALPAAAVELWGSLGRGGFRAARIWPACRLRSRVLTVDCQRSLELGTTSYRWQFMKQRRRA
jgi:purine-binding chemotaxis protein CheW